MGLNAIYMLVSQDLFSACMPSDGSKLGALMFRKQWRAKCVNKGLGHVQSLHRNCCSMGDLQAVFFLVSSKVRPAWAVLASCSPGPLVLPCKKRNCLGPCLALLLGGLVLALVGHGPLGFLGLGGGLQSWGPNNWSTP